MLTKKLKFNKNILFLTNLLVRCLKKQQAVNSLAQRFGHDGARAVRYIVKGIYILDDDGNW